MKTNSRFNYSWQFVATVWAVAIALVLGMNAMSFGASTQTVKTCVDKKSGSMRYVPTGKCKKSERLVSIGGAGTVGAAGQAGAAGQPGLQGEQGLPGAQGLPGEQGVQGVQGEQGVPGSNATVQFGSLSTWQPMQQDPTQNFNSALSADTGQTWGILNGETRGQITIGANEPFQLNGTVTIDVAASDFANYGLCAFAINTAHIGFAFIAPRANNQSVVNLVYTGTDWPAGTYSIGIDCTPNVGTFGASLNIIVN